MRQLVAPLVEKQRKRFILAETTWLIAICMIDMYLTLYLVRSGLATEANPLLKKTLEISNGTFLVVKGLSFMIPLILIEFVRPLNPAFISRAMRAAVVSYALIYFIGVVGLHLIP